MATCIYFLKRFIFSFHEKWVISSDQPHSWWWWMVTVKTFSGSSVYVYDKISSSWHRFFLKVNIVTTYCHSIFICKWFYLMTYFHNSDLTNIALNLEFKLIEWNLISLPPPFLSLNLSLSSFICNVFVLFMPECNQWNLKCRCTQPDTIFTSHYYRHCFDDHTFV